MKGMARRVPWTACWLTLLLLLSVMVGTMASVMSSTIVNVAMPDIMGEFGMGQDQVQWLSTAFLAAMTASMLTTDWMLRAFGLRHAYLGAMAAFLAATTHAPIMSTLMICEMTGQYVLLPGLLIASVLASVLSRTLRQDSIYRHHVAEHG